MQTDRGRERERGREGERERERGRERERETRLWIVKRLYYTLHVHNVITQRQICRDKDNLDTTDNKKENCRTLECNGCPPPRLIFSKFCLATDVNFLFGLSFPPQFWDSSLQVVSRILTIFPDGILYIFYYTIHKIFDDTS